MPDDTKADIDRLTTEAWEARTSELATARDRATRALTLAQDTGYAKGEADSLSVLAYCQIATGELTDALGQALRALTTYRKLDDDRGEAYTAHLVSQAYRQMNDLPRALEYALPALEAAKRIDDPRYRMGLLMTLGGAYVDRGDYDAALRCAHEVLTASDEATTPGFHADALNSIAYTHYLTGDPEIGLEYADRALQLHEAVGWSNRSLYCLHTVGVIHLALGNLTDARTYLERGLEGATAEGARASTIEFRVELGRLSQREGDIDSAFEHLHRALEVAEGLGSPLRQAEVHQRLAELYKSTGDFERALRHHETYHRLDKEVFNDQSDQRMRALQVQHDVTRAQKEAELYRLENVSLQAEVEHRKQTETELREIAAKDPLTGVYNRQSFERRAEDVLGQATRSGEPLGLALLDMDEFKALNDTHGHLTGDAVLRALTQRVGSLMRPSDVLGRYGGDEFVLLLRDATREGGRDVAERIRRSIEDQTLAPHAAIKTSVSIGVVHRPADAETTLLELLERADKVLYQAKKFGKNRVQLWDEA